MNMHLVDWGIVAAFLAVLVWGAASTRKFNRSVLAFLAADRCGGRYLIAVADEMSRVGVITLVGYFEAHYEAGFTPIWWQLMEGPALIVMALSGWVIYRFRQTRALTLAQFFEMRYSRSFRVFCGIVAYVAGIINFAIFPSVGARFFIALCGLPSHVHLAGFSIQVYALLVALLLLSSLALLLLGGQIAVMVTDFIQGVFSNTVFIVIIAFLLITFHWHQVSDVLLAAPAGKSLVNPFNQNHEEYFNFWFYAIAVVILFYNAKGWQGTQGYNACAKSAHEAKMANMLSHWRFRVLMLIVVVLPICVRTLMTHPDFAPQAAIVNDSLDAIDAPSAEVKKALQHQLRSPLAMGVMLPAGMLGLACAAMLGAFVSTHDTYLHSWGSILVQDVILPLRREPLSPKAHLRLLRLSILGVAVFIFVVSLFFQHTQYILMFCALTASVFVGGAGAVIIGGLYWKHGTTEAAWAAMIVGMVLSCVGLAMKQLIPQAISLTGQEIAFWTLVLAIATYIAVSLLGPRRQHNMDRLLHRGAYAVKGEKSASPEQARTVWQKLGFTSEFTGSDRVVAYVTLSWPLVWTVIFVAVTSYALLFGIPDATWLAFWHGWVWFILVSAVIVTLWFAIGGIGDMRYLYRSLRSRKADVTDDGRVGPQDSPDGP